jgi:hypothetical protein
MLVSVCPQEYSHCNITGLNIIFFKDAISGFEPDAAATGCGQGGAGMLRQDVSPSD